MAQNELKTQLRQGETRRNAARKVAKTVQNSTIKPYLDADFALRQAAQRHKKAKNIPAALAKMEQIGHKTPKDWLQEAKLHHLVGASDACNDDF